MITKEERERIVERIRTELEIRKEVGKANRFYADAPSTTARSPIRWQRARSRHSRHME